eukprot:snap_masked-scaffold_23-processed-gene-3.23-mRNA-1 protein AED:1.00 eAED:1.00 QI:0/0/0/0/1/1/2/0/236
MENLRKEPYTIIWNNGHVSYIYPITDSCIYKYDRSHKFIVQKHTKDLMEENHFLRAFESHRDYQTVKIEINKGETLTDEMIKILSKCIMLLKENVVIKLTFLGFSELDIVDPTLLNIKKAFLFEKRKKIFINCSINNLSYSFFAVNLPAVFELIDGCLQKEDSFILQEAKFLTKKKSKAKIIVNTKAEISFFSFFSVSFDNASLLYLCKFFSMNKYTNLKNILYQSIFKILFVSRI